MAQHKVDYSYDLPEWGSTEIDIDEDLDYLEKEAIALAEIKEMYSDINNIEIEKIEVL